METITTISKAFNNKNLKRIVNVYQLKYKNSVAQGLGDYIRGCFCLMQICAMLGLSFDMDLKNHPISKYLIQQEAEQESEKKTKYNINYAEVSRYENTNYVPINATTYSKNSINFFIEYVKNLNAMGGTESFFTFCHSFPIFEVQDMGRKFILSKLLPNEIMQNAIKERLTRLELMVKRFAVIHIRSGDKYLLNNGNLNSFVVKKIIGILSKNMKEGTKYLILSDNNQIKLLLKKVFPQVVIQLTKIAHLGESVNPDDNAVMETMLDFYLMSNAFQIISFSPYNWGSGFSQWCSVLYKIPYTQIQVVDRLS
jgi:hypothetical protein